MSNGCVSQSALEIPESLTSTPLSWCELVQVHNALTNVWVSEELIMEIGKYLGLSDDESTTYQNLQDEAKILDGNLKY